MAKSVEGVGEAVNSDANSDPKQLARQLLSEGLGVDAVAEESGLSRMVVLGLKGALIKASKRLAATQDKAPPENVGEAEISLDLKKEAQITNQAVALARSQQRLKSLDPKSEFLHGGQQQPEGNTSRVLVDLETARLIRSMRQETEEQERHKNNGGGAEATETLNLRKEVDALREEIRKKDVEDLKGQIAEMRQEMRHSTNSGSDLAVVVREASGLLEKIVTSDGPLRSYLMPDNNIPIKPRGDAPLLQGQPAGGQNGLVDVLRERGLTTRIVHAQR